MTNMTKASANICIEDTRLYSRGFRVGIQPLDYVFPVLMIQLISMFLLYRVLRVILKPFKQPKFVCNILGGFILGPSGLGRNKMFREKILPITELPLLQLLSTVAMIFFIFLIAMKTSFRVILQTAKKKSWIIGMSCLIVPVLAAGLLHFCMKHYVYDYTTLMNKKTNGYGIIGTTFVLALTAFPHIAQGLDELNLLTSEAGQLAMTCAGVNDMLRIFLVIVSSSYKTVKKFGIFDGVKYIGAALIVMLYVLRPIPKWIIKITPEGKPVKEAYIIGILVMVLAIGSLTEKYLMSYINGALLFGFIIPNGPPLGSTLVQKTEFIIFEILQPLIFIEIGRNMNVFSIKNWKLVGVYACFIGVGSVAKLVGAFVPASFKYKMSYRNALSLGLIMNIKGLMEASFFMRWKDSKILDDQNYAILILSITAVTAIVTPLITLVHKRKERVVGSSENRVRTIQSASIASEFRILVCIHDEECAGSVISLLEASNPTKICPLYTYVVHFFEIVGQDAPLLLPYQRHGGRISNSTKTDNIMRAFERFSKYYNGEAVKVQPFTVAAPFKSIHGFFSRLAQDNDIPLIIVPVNKIFGVHEEEANTLRNLNTNIQENTPCTVGLLVIRASHDSMRFTQFSYHIAVIFLGGADDREGLAYGIRMSNHPKVSTTVLRIHFSNGGGEDETTETQVERQLDNLLVNEFKKQNINNPRAVYHEKEVEDIVEAINLIQSLEDEFDVMIVGRRRGSDDKLLDEEMLSWNANPELGVIGDVLVSSDLIGSMVSVLVMQHFVED